jgi:hypothetical protein
MSALIVAAGILSLQAWGGVRVGELACPLALVLAFSAVAFLGSPDRRPVGLIHVPLAAGLVLAAFPATGTGYRFGVEMTAAGLLLVACWLGLWTADRWSRRRAADDLAVQERLKEAVCEDLARARRLVPPHADNGQLAQLDELVLRGELAAALGELEALGLSFGAPSEYWHALASAAGRMGLAEARERLTSRR